MLPLAAMLRRTFIARSLLITGGLALAGRLPAADAPNDGADPALVVLPPLPYAEDALAPHVSAETISFHYGKHHRAYVDGVNRLAPGTPFAGKPLTDIVLHAEAGPLFNNAAQVWNHTFYWSSMKPKGGGEPAGALRTALERDFGSVDAARAALRSAALGVFGSGWVWLVLADDRLVVTTTANADCPLRQGQAPLLVCDVWEHAYYIDHRNRRADHVDAFLTHLVDWDFAAANLAAAQGA